MQPLIEKKHNNDQSSEQLTATKGKKQVIIQTKDIAVIYLENEMVWIQTIKGENTIPIIPLLPS